MKSSSKYMYLYESLKADIYHHYQGGCFLPTETELMKKYNVSRTTVRHAVQLLKKDGIIEIRQGQGTRVLLGGKPQYDEFVLFHNVVGATHFFPKIEGEYNTSVAGGVIDTIPATDEIAKALEIEPGTNVYRLERLIALNEAPMIMCRNYFRYDLFPGLEAYSGKIEYIYDVYGFFEWKYNIHFVKGQHFISTTTVSFFDAEILNIDSGTPLLLLSRKSTCEKGLFEFTKWMANPEMLNVVINMEGPRKYSQSRF